MPYQMSVDKQEDDSIFSAKIVHKTLHSQDSYQIFEFAKVNQTAENNFGVFAINTASLETLPIWQPEVLLQKYSDHFLTQSLVSEMDPNLVFLRLGGFLNGQIEGSGPLGSVNDGDVYAINYIRKDFYSKRDASRHTTLVKENLESYHLQMLSEVEARQKHFDERFSKIFGHTEDSELLLFLQEALSNTLGSIGHSSGALKVNITSFGNTATKEKGVAELLASYPSRPRYARGFLWDEGFHLNLICQWSEHFCIEIVESWILSEDMDGWIPPEQARGREARSNIPEEF